MNSYCFHIHFSRLVVCCFRSFNVHLSQASLFRLNLPNTMMVAQPCRFGIMGRDGTPPLAIFPGCCGSIEFHESGGAPAHRAACAESSTACSRASWGTR